MNKMRRPRDVSGKFGFWLNKMMNEYDCTYSELSNILGISRVTLRQFATKRVQPSRLHIYGLAYIFHENANMLFALVAQDWPDETRNKTRWK